MGAVLLLFKRDFHGIGGGRWAQKLDAFALRTLGPPSRDPTNPDSCLTLKWIQEEWRLSKLSISQH